MSAPTVSATRIRELDGIRGLAIALVLVFHVHRFLPDSGVFPTVKALLVQTWCGVDLFFVLSGFLIGGILIDHRRSANSFKVFYTRRGFRILPLYFAWLLLFVVLIQIVPTTREPWANLFDDAMPLWTYSTFTHNFAMAAANETGHG